VKESPEARKERQQIELWQFIDVLRRAGNSVTEEFRFHPERRWRFDIALTVCPVGTKYENIAIEIQGLGGGHQTNVGFKRDLEKFGEAFAAGWTVLCVSRQAIKDGTALDLLARRGVRVEAADQGRTYFHCECPRAHGRTKEGLCANCGGTLA
jgi:hypothetical protein